MVALPDDPIDVTDLIGRWGISKQAVHRWVVKMERLGFRRWNVGRAIVLSLKDVREYEALLKRAGQPLPGQRKAL
jgi:hypothetical protein